MYIKLFLFALVCVAFQIGVFNYIQFWGYGTPLVCILPILLFPAGTDRWIVLLSGFLLGITEDMFINTPGVSAASFTLLAMVQPIFVTAFFQEETNSNLSPVRDWLYAGRMGWRKYIYYLLASTFVVCFVFFVLQNFSFFNLGKLVLNVLSSWVMTVLCILVIESVRVNNKKKEEA